MSSFYNLTNEHENDFFTEPLQGWHWAQLCLLFNLDENDSEKLTSAGITNGLSVEEKILGLINFWDNNSKGKNVLNRPKVCCDKDNSRVHGIILSNKEYYVLPLCTSAVTNNLLYTRIKTTRIILLKVLLGAIV